MTDRHEVATATVTCPRCGSEPGTDCVWGTTHSKGKAHAPRIQLSEATSTKNESKMAITKTTKKPAAKKAAPKRDPSLCRAGQGRYGAPKSEKLCTNKSANGAAVLCADHEQRYRDWRKARHATLHPTKKPASKTKAAMKAASTKRPVKATPRKASDHRAPAREPKPQARRSRGAGRTSSAQPKEPIARVKAVAVEPTLVVAS